ncbi:MAG: type II toxin-antitoxin system VapC family toxin [Nitrospiraceae bacterium]|nr:type II toxin-antitoxin system VapC family toxin [Nitrospiraceae bacterium]
MYLIDTNVVSEARKGEGANAGVRKFWQRSREESMFLPVQANGEIRHGLEMIRRRGDLSQVRILGDWLAQLTEEYADRILAFDASCAHVWGKLMALDPNNPVDKQIASLALIFDLTVVTRDTGYFEKTGVRLLNPFI